MKRHAIVILILATLASGLIPVAAGQTTPVYNNTSNVSEVQESWLDGRQSPTLDNISSHVARGVPFVIAGDPEPNAWIMAILVGVLVVSAVGVGGTGLTAGLVAMAVTGLAISTTGAPEWIEASVVVLIGLLAGVIYLRMRR